MNNLDPNSSPTLLSGEDFAFFRNWSQINLDNITWQGKYKREFEDFWNIFFVDGLSLQQITERFEYAATESGIGSLNSWFEWLKEKFLCYVFVFKGLSVFQISRETGISPGILANTFRILLVENFPHLQTGLNEKFQISDMVSKNLSITYDEIAKTFSIKEDVFSNVNNDDIMTSLEITLYKEWKFFLTKLKKNFIHSHFNLKRIRRLSSLKWQLNIFRDLILLASTCIGLIYGIRYINQKYETSLNKKISIYEPQFKWSDKNLNFRKIASDNSKKLKIDVKNIEEVDDATGSISSEEERFDVESEVSLTSWDALPKNFDIADREQSDYEELGSGYRESRYGNTKVYRVLMKSEDILEAKSYLDTLLKKYKITQVDNVKPGMRVPGGIYYNLYVPIRHLKEFMAQAMEERDAILYQSRTRAKRNPPGKSKVFIWVKSI